MYLENEDKIECFYLFFWIQLCVNSPLKKVHATETLNVGISTRSLTRADHSVMVDARAPKITLSASKLVSTNVKIQLYKKVRYRLSI